MKLTQKFTGLDFPLYEVDSFVHAPQIPGWCKLPYPGHPKGCPNYGNRDDCPPKAKYIDKTLDLNRPIFFVHSEFNLAAHIDKMKLNHPSWSERQCRCVLYWQGRSRKQMMERAKIAVRYLQANIIITKPEAFGVQVYLSCKRSGLTLEPIKGLKICRHVAFIGWKP